MYYAIGDIHGEITLLKSLYSKILAHIEDTHDQNPVIVFLGDYVDRGEDSKAVLDFLMGLKDTDSLSHVFIKGNHEDLMIQASEGLKNNNSWPSRVWLQNGGRKTLQDFNMDLPDLFGGKLKKYTDWMDGCLNYFKTHQYVFCHGGVDTREKLENTLDEVFLWKRNNGSREYMSYDRIVVHGHTPTRDGKVLKDFNEINVDTGAFFSKVLTAIVLPEIQDSVTLKDSQQIVNALECEVIVG